VSQDVTVGNIPPTADFTWVASGLGVEFADLSADDGAIAEWGWDFGDESGASSEQNPDYTYTEAGTYTVTLTVTDDGGKTDSHSQAVMVTAPSTTQEIEVASIDFPTAGPHLKIVITVVSTDGSLLDGIEVYSLLDDQPQPVEVTDSSGQVTYLIKRGASTPHTVIVTDLVDTRDPVLYEYYAEPYIAEY
jgi:PKD repeat protein